MMSTAEINEAIAVVAAQDASGWRRVCCFCKRDLPGSNPNSTRVTHGACLPLCEPALAMGYKPFSKPTSTKN